MQAPFTTNVQVHNAAIRLQTTTGTAVATASKLANESSRKRTSQDTEFLGLLEAYRASGGLATGAEIAARRPQDGLSQLARAIAMRDVIALEWRGQRWLPYFQFKAGDIAVREPVRTVCDELTAVLDDWALVRWFAEPNVLLNGAAPLAVLNTDHRYAHNAARALRFALKS